MDEDQLISKTEALIDECAKTMKRHLAVILEKNFIDLDTHDQPQRLPKTILEGLLRYEAKSWELLDPGAQAESNEVYRKLFSK